MMPSGVALISAEAIGYGIDDRPGDYAMSESLRRTNPRDNAEQLFSGEQLFGYGDLVARRRWRTIILCRLVRAGAADDGGPGPVRVAEGIIEQ
jgi:hypothetical protein